MRRDNPKRRLTFTNILKENTGNDLNTLEIGVAAGDYSRLMLDTLSIKSHTLLDPWLNEGDETRSQWFKENNDANKSYEFVVDRIKDDPVIINREFSHEFLIRTLKESNQPYDLIYVDGDHHAEAVYLDLVLSWEILKSGGILAGDDYNWQSSTTGKYEVKMGVIKFEQTYGVKFNIVKGDNGGLDQFWLKK